MCCLKNIKKQGGSQARNWWLSSGIIFSWEESYIFLLISKTDGFTIICGDTTIFEYQEGKNEARSSIGLVLPHIGFSMHKFVNENSFNPVRASDRYNMEESALPAIIRDYTSL